jgi:polyisoprenoid-binding protein YceI
MAWEVDLAHSSLEFAVRHMLVSTVKGTFLAFSVDAEIDDEDVAKSRATVKVNAASLDTREPRRDAHLRSADFFDTERFPTIIYTVKSIDKVSSDRYRITGDLTIREITREIPLDAEISGLVADPFGALRLGISAEGRVNRHDYGLDWNLVTEAGGLLVGDDVKISVEAEFVKTQAPEEEIAKEGEPEKGAGKS